MASASAPTPSQDGSLPGWSRRRGYLLAVLVLVGSLVLVLAYARGAREREARIADARHVAAAERLATMIQERLLRYELALRGGVSLFSSVSRPTARQWGGYVDGLNLRRQFPGLMGLGYAPYLRGDELERLQLEIREQGGGLFTIRPPGVREAYGPILYLEPKTPGNIAAIGYDMFSEHERHAAMAAARDSGQVRMSAPVRLLQQPAESESTGLLMYAPVYAGGLQPETLQARRVAMSGWVYAPFSVDEFIAGVIGNAADAYALRIVDVGAGGAVVHHDPRFEGTPGRTYAIDRDVYGRRWRIEFQALGTDTDDELETALLAGILASLLLFAMVLTLAHTQTRAERIAARMSESYRRSELRFRSAMQYSAAGTALLDGEGRIVEANPAIGELFDCRPEELVGQRLESRLADGHQTPDGVPVPREGDSVLRTMRHLLREGGDRRHLHLVWSRVPGEIDSDVAWLVQIEDVTDRLRAEERVRAMNRLLEARVEQRTRELTRANAELESFAYTVSHDLRAPLRSIEGFSRVLADRYSALLGEEGSGYLARIRNAALRMDALIDALLKLSRISREEMRLVQLDIGEIAADVVAELRQAHPGREVEVVIGTGLQAAGDPVLVRDLLQNLLGNAWKFTRDVAQPRIEVLADAPRDGEEGLRAFVVRDNGAGFEAGYAGKLFRPFQRLHDPDRFGGHGIGLATVKRIVERHGGSVEASGRPGEGATFRFTLPASAEPAHEA